MKELFENRDVPHVCTERSRCDLYGCTIHALIDCIETHRLNNKLDDNLFVNSFLVKFANLDTHNSTFFEPNPYKNLVQVTDKFSLHDNKILYFRYSVEYDGWHLTKTFINYEEGKYE